MSDTKGIVGQYTGQDGILYHDTVHNFPPNTREWIVNGRAAKLNRHIDSADNVLEYGAGFGFNMSGLSCAKLTAYDVADHLSNLYKETNIDFVSSLDCLARESYDKIICHHVLEHLPDPAGALAEISELLSNDGKLLLYIPKELSRRYNKINPNDKDHHIFSWNRQTLHNLVTGCGYEVESIREIRFGYDFVAARLANRLLAAELVFRGLKFVAHILRPVYEFELIAKHRGKIA